MSGGSRFAVVLVLFVVGLGMSFALQRVPGVGVAREGDDAPRGEAPQRIVALAPSVTECLFALGVGDRVVGVGDFCFHPPEAKAKPRCGGEFNPNYEQILTLKPDLLIVQGRAEKVEEFARRHDVRLLRVEVSDLEAIVSDLLALGRALGVQGRAERLAARIRLDLAEVAWRVAGRPRPKVFLSVGRQTGSLRALLSAGGDTFLSEMVEAAGGRNVLADVPMPYPQVSKEDLVGRAPEVILEIQAGADLSEGTREQLVADWQSLPSLPAVRDGRVHVLTDDFLLIPGPRLAQVAERFADVLHPATGADDGR